MDENKELYNVSNTATISEDIVKEIVDKVEEDIKEDISELEDHPQEVVKPKKKRIGFTDKLAIYLVALLGVGIILGAFLAYLSIKEQYTGALLCYTVVFTPIGTACSIVLNSIVNKNKAENTWGDKGIKYAAAEASGFVEENDFPINSINENNQSIVGNQNQVPVEDPIPDESVG